MRCIVNVIFYLLSTFKFHWEKNIDICAYWYFCIYEKPPWWVLIKSVLFCYNVVSPGNGQMDFEEFVKLMVAKNQFSFNEEEAKEAFRIFDRDCRGYVMSDELRQVFQTLEEKIPEHEINDMLQDQKHQFNRKITFDGNYHFIKWK